VLASLTVATGIAAAALLDPLVTQAAADLDPRAHEAGLGLWHGLGVPLALSGVTLGMGALLIAARRPVQYLLAAITPTRGAADAYAATIRLLNLLARRTAGIAQNGSLPVYIAIILLTTIAVPSSVLVRANWPGWPVVAESPAQVVIAVLIAVSAFAATVARRRFSAALLLGAVGYGMSLVFVVQGAPDLALTQFAIETLTVVAFVLVLRFLPAEFHRRRPALGVPVRVAVSATVAVAVFAFAIVSAAARQADPISDELIERSLPEAGGRNVVNVVLVDFRGLDTLGEISVLVVAGLGVVALGRVGRRQRPARRPPLGREEQ
jgi:multicomponent Na+:H+ antiporter subunit A